MVLNEEQEKAVEAAVKRYKAKEPYTVLSGPAGSGKTTTLKYIIEALGLNPEEDICFAAPTGKAAQVLRKRGNPNAQTLHKLLYKASLDNYGFYHFFPKDEIDDFKLICVDEVSMVPKRIWEQLLSHGIPVLAMGDHHQLPPPIDEAGGNNVLDNPHIILSQVMRQEEGNEIIDLATHIRLGKPLCTYKGTEKEVKIIQSTDLVTGHYTWADQILCATNETRVKGNKLKREILGYDPLRPQIGDSIISLKNHWDFISEDGEPLINGSIGRILDYRVNYIRFPKYIYPGNYALMQADIQTEDGEIFRNVPIDFNCLLTGKKTLNDRQDMLIKKNKKIKMLPPFEMNYSYLATVWKYQGDQANKILLFEEKFPFDTETHRRYLYTGITRAVERCVIVRK